MDLFIVHIDKSHIPRVYNIYNDLIYRILIGMTSTIGKVKSILLKVIEIQNASVDLALL